MAQEFEVLEFVDLSAQASAALQTAVAHGVEASALIIADEVKAVINESKPAGEWYFVPGTRTKYQASAPGQPPAERENVYAPAWRSTPAVHEGGQVVAEAYNPITVGKNDQHLLALVLEYGTLDGRIKPRPHIFIAIKRAETQIAALWKKLKVRG